MKILLTNDDGYFAEGIQSLYKVLSKEHQVKIAAPMSNKSGYSASFSFFRGHDFKQFGQDIFALEASPVDCVMASIKGKWLSYSDGSFMPDLLISGINHGANLGTDITYSGTVGAARQGALYGIPSFALSLEKLDWSSPEPYCFDEFSAFILKNLKTFLEILPGKKMDFPDCQEGLLKNPLEYFLNINAPSVKKYRGLKVASVSHRVYEDEYFLKENEDGSKTSFCKACSSIKTYGGEGCDFEIVKSGYVALSLLKTSPEAVMDFDFKALNNLSF